ncbi:MAG: hypothetical protein KDK12_14905 [Rhodobacteraceae bacterium]|nr:hypothetical protein [Paracoccaceae bacterium]
MFEFLPEDIRRGLQAARKRADRKGSRLSVHAGDEVFPILRLSETGFVVDSERVPSLRGFVDIYNGPRHIIQALVIGVTDEAGEATYEFKRETVISAAPIRDYADERPEHGGFLPNPV